MNKKEIEINVVVNREKRYHRNYEFSGSVIFFDLEKKTVKFLLMCKRHNESILEIQYFTSLDKEALFVGIVNGKIQTQKLKPRNQCIFTLTVKNIVSSMEYLEAFPQESNESIDIFKINGNKFDFGGIYFSPNKTIYDLIF